MGRGDGSAGGVGRYDGGNSERRARGPFAEGVGKVDESRVKVIEEFDQG